MFFLHVAWIFKARPGTTDPDAPEALVGIERAHNVCKSITRLVSVLLGIYFGTSKYALSTRTCLLGCIARSVSRRTKTVAKHTVAEKAYTYSGEARDMDVVILTSTPPEIYGTCQAQNIVYASFQQKNIHNPDKSNSFNYTITDKYWYRHDASTVGAVVVTVKVAMVSVQNTKHFLKNRAQKKTR
ncbi:hypothetical protein BC835DRAFT_1303669 [Cytidiella melzeri]|nr:hypothetical protein BC835DRAFT_1303669 [Cytidiella melzeri]